MRLIDADAFKDNMDKMCDAEGWLEPLTIVIVKYIKQKIDDQKTIEQKTGKWIYSRVNGVKQCKCSECLTSYGCIDTPFCPNCGARMVGEEE